MYRTAFVLLLAIVLSATSAAIGNTPLLQHRVLGYLTNLGEDYLSVTPAFVKERLDAKTLPLILDVREPNEFAQGRIDGAVNIPIRTLAQNIQRLPTSRSTEIITVCPSGFRSAQVTMALTLIGYTNVKTMVLGMREWNARGFPVVR
jgi:rhodanese-related sulfurtransferase